MEENISINLGTLSSFNSLYRNAAPTIDIIRNKVAHGERPNIIWDFSYAESRRISMSALTAFLSVAFGISKAYGKSIPLLMRWDPYVLRFLTDIGFFKVAEELHILHWSPNLVGGMVQKKTNPNTKIIFFDGIPDKSKFQNSISLMNDWKEKTREDLIIKQLYSDIDSLLIHEDFYSDWHERLVRLLSSTIAELIVNSLLHGEDVAFVGLQKSPRGVTVCICDGGVGFLKAMKKNQTWSAQTGLNTNIDALVNASLMNKHEIGLRRAIEDIIVSDGYIIMSSVDCELCWTKNNWYKAKELFDSNNYKSVLQSAKQILGEEQHNTNENFSDGYYRNFGSKLKGTRIIFEIPSKV